MAIQSMDDIIYAIGAGQFHRADWNTLTHPVAAQVAGMWHDLARGAGNPPANSVIGGGTNLAHQAISDTTSTTAVSTSGVISTTTFTDTTHDSGRFTIGTVLSGTGVADGTTITALGTGTGDNAGGTYTVSISQTTSATEITGTQYAGGIYTGGSVGSLSKHLLNASVVSASATSAPAVFMLVDIVASYTITSVTAATEQLFTGQAAWPRYANGKGVQAFLSPSVVMGAGARTVRLKYTNTADSAGRFTPAAPALPTTLTACPVGAVTCSGTGVGKYGPFIPLQSGDAGIKSVQSIQFNGTMTSGCMNLVICKPIATIPLTTIGVAGERDFLNMIPSLPVIPDGACLSWLQYAGAATPVNSSYMGHLDTVWR